MTDPITAGFDFKCDRGETLTGDGTALHCDHCRETVYDLATLTHDGAIALLARPHIPCVRLTVGGDGRAMFRRPRRLARAVLAGALASALVGGAAAEPPPDPSVFATAAARLDALITEAEADAANARAEAVQAEAVQVEAAQVEAAPAEIELPPIVIAKAAPATKATQKAAAKKTRKKRATPPRHTLGRPRR